MSDDVRFYKDLASSLAHGMPNLGRLAGSYLRVVDSGIPEQIREGDSRTLRRARITLSLVLALCLLGVEAGIFFAYMLPYEPAMQINLAILGTTAIGLTIPSILRVTQSLTITANLLIFNCYIVLITTLSVFGGIRSPLLHWFGLLPLLMVMTGGRRSAWVWCGITLASLGCLVAIDLAGVRIPNHMNLGLLPAHTLLIQRSTDLVSWMGLLLAIAFLYEGYTEQQTAMLISQNAELEDEVRLRQEAEQRSHYLAHYDELTTLPNRRFFQQRLSRALSTAARSERVVAVLFLDLDAFKSINDTHGHAAGDELLKQVAQRLAETVRDSDSIMRGHDEADDSVSRLGGDEFTILLEGLRSYRDAAIVADRVLQCLEPAISLFGCEVFITASIGIGLSAPDVGVEEILHNADTALYHAKAAGRNTFHFFDPSMNLDVIEHKHLINELREALQRDEFELHYQPILSAEFERVAGVEALIRWRSPKRGMVFPDEFIGLAEESGLINSLGDWIVRRACEDYRRWSDAGIAPARVAINVSGLQFRRMQILRTVVDALEKSSLAPQSLELEITESAMMIDESEVLACLLELKRIGVRVALDDFGTGYSSLSYVKRFPVDSVKIDRSFVAEIEQEPDARAITSAIVAMAHQLGLNVVAEGVETEEQKECLRAHGCDELQGFLFAKPMSASRLADFLARSV